jgi:hypothetical protein
MVLLAIRNRPLFRVKQRPACTDNWPHCFRSVFAASTIRTPNGRAPDRSSKKWPERNQAMLATCIGGADSALEAGEQHASRQLPSRENTDAKDARSHSHSRLCGRTGVPGQSSHWIRPGFRYACVGPAHCARSATGTRQWLWPGHWPWHWSGWLS